MLDDVVYPPHSSKRAPHVPNRRDISGELTISGKHSLSRIDEGQQSLDLLRDGSMPYCEFLYYKCKQTFTRSLDQN